MLCLKNSLAKWQHKAERPAEVRNIPVYTASPVEASKYRGWSEAVIQQFNELQQQFVPAMRKSL